MQEAWAICRIFKKPNSNAQRALSQSWISPVSHNTTTAAAAASHTNLNFSCSYTTTSNETSTPLQLPVYPQWPNTEAISPPINHASSLLLDISTSDYNGVVEAEMVQENVEVDYYSFVNLLWDSSPCPSHLSTPYSTNNCYT